MSVCLHCGELAPDGALFCAKCGFTLPQPGVGGGSGSPPPPSTPGGMWTSGPTSNGTTVPPPTPGSSAPAPPPTRGSSPPIPMPSPAAYWPPPPNGKYCVRCGTLIARPAVYCPVCQQPQPP
ncbi:MAG: zinc-ribbon domain-containing protein [Thermoplasmata archaeon]